MKRSVFYFGRIPGPHPACRAHSRSQKNASPSIGLPSGLDIPASIRSNYPRQAIIQGSGLNLREVVIEFVTAADEARFQALMEAHHYLGALPQIGNTIGSLACWRGEWLALLSFSAAALECGARDDWNWDETAAQSAPAMGRKTSPACVAARSA